MANKEGATKPKISVLMSFRNAEGYVAEAVSSILNQTFTDFELILTNDNSTDRSGEVLQRLLSDPRVRYLENPTRLGKPKTLNNGLKRARAKLIAIMDGDDISDPNRLSIQYEYMMGHPEVTLVGSFLEMIDDSGAVIDRVQKPTDSETIKKVSFLYSPFTHGTVMYRKSAIEEIGQYREEYSYCQDIDLFLRVIHSGYQTANIPEYLYRYRRHPNNTRHSKVSYTNAFKIKRRIKKEYKLNLSPVEICSLYGHLVLDILLTSEQKRVAESMIKRVVMR